MHIVHLSTRRDYYGAEVCLANLATGLAARGNRVSCLVQPGSALAGRLADSNVEVVPMSLLDWFDPGTIGRVGRWLRAHKADVLATHLPRDYFIAAAASRGLSICNIATRHRIKPISLPLLKRPFLRNFGAMVAVSEAVALGVRNARLMPLDRVVTIPNGIVEPTGSAPVVSLRARYDVPETVPVVGLVGKLCPDKGADFLLRAVGLLNNEWPELHVFLVGAEQQGGAYRQSLQKIIRESSLAGRVHFAGFVPDAARYSREFDVQVIASHAEPFGLVTVEAMAAAVPVVATAAGGTLEIIRDGIEGFLVPPGDIPALANRLSCLLGSAGLRYQMGQQGRTRFEAKYTAARMIDNTVAVYKHALNASGPS